MQDIVAINAGIEKIHTPDWKCPWQTEQH